MTGMRLYRRKEECCSAKLLARNMAAIGRHADEFANVLHFDDLHIIIESVLAGEGIALISSSIVRSHLEAGRLHQHRVPGFQHTRRRTLAFRRQRCRTEEFDFLRTCILETFGVAGNSSP